MNRFLHRCLTRTPVVGLLMAALLFRALIPAGFMPTQGESGAIVMQLCSGFGTKSVIVDLAPDSKSKDASSQLFEHSPCGFTAAALAAPPADTISFPVQVSLHAIAVVADTSTVTNAALERAQSPRAPPSI